MQRCQHVIFMFTSPKANASNHCCMTSVSIPDDCSSPAIKQVSRESLRRWRLLHQHRRLGPPGIICAIIAENQLLRRQVRYQYMNYGIKRWTTTVEKFNFKTMNKEIKHMQINEIRSAAWLSNGSKPQGNENETERPTKRLPQLRKIGAFCTAVFGTKKQ